MQIKFKNFLNNAEEGLSIKMVDKENDVDEIITIEAVSDFLQKHDGKAKQVDLVNHFRAQLNSPATKGNLSLIHI